MSGVTGGMTGGDAFGVAGAGMDLASLMRARAVSILRAAGTLAGTQVEAFRDMAITGDDLFFIAVYTPRIQRAWLGDSPPNYQAKVELVIIGKATGRTGAEAEWLTDTLRIQIENALLTSAAFWAMPLERINTIESVQELPGDAEQHEGFITMRLECQCVDVFPVTAGAPLELAGVTVPNPSTPASNTVPADNLIGAAVTIPQGA